MKNLALKVGLGGIAFGVLINSLDIRVSEPFKFDNPIGRTKEIEYFNGTDFVREQVPLSEQDIRNIVNKRPEMIDKTYSLDLFNWDIPLVTERTVYDSSIETEKVLFEGTLDSEGNIHAKKGIVYKLEHAHDSQYYTKN